jgi:hypothetical protein
MTGLSLSELETRHGSGTFSWLIEPVGRRPEAWGVADGASIRPLDLLRLFPAVRARAELRRLETDNPLPGPEDFEALLSPPAIGVAWARKVSSATLWVLYRLDSDVVSLQQLATRPPTPVD